jgi:uncharacterized protein YbbK (DUF523 family)
MDNSITKQVRSRTIKTKDKKNTLLFNTLNTHSITVGISACLTGELVRYDGKTKYSPQLFHGFDKKVHWQPLCPEMHAGLGVPRPAVQLIASSTTQSETNKQNWVEARGVADPNVNVTPQLRQASHDLVNKHPDIQIWLLKARSPSCGYLSTPLHSAEGKELGITNGLFAEHCRQYTPWAAIYDEAALQHRAGKIRFYLSALLSKDILSCPDELLPTLVQHYRRHGLLKPIEAKTPLEAPEHQFEAQALFYHGQAKITLCQQVHHHIKSWSDADTLDFDQRWSLLRND